MDGLALYHLAGWVITSLVAPRLASLSPPPSYPIPMVIFATVLSNARVVVWALLCSAAAEVGITNPTSATCTLLSLAGFATILLHPLIPQIRAALPSPQLTAYTGPAAAAFDRLATATLPFQNLPTSYNTTFGPFLAPPQAVIVHGDAGRTGPPAHCATSAPAWPAYTRRINPKPAAVIKDSLISTDARFVNFPRKSLPSRPRTRKRRASNRDGLRRFLLVAEANRLQERLFTERTQELLASLDSPTGTTELVLHYSD